MNKLSLKTVGFFVLAGLMLLPLPQITSGMALLLGIVCSIFSLSYRPLTQKSGVLLKTAIVLMGFGLPIGLVISNMQTSFWLTSMTISTTFFLGFLLLKALKIDFKTGLLVITGTAICGGSAIATVSPVIQANNEQVSMSLVVVFLLNAIGLYLFPILGGWLNFTPELFGYWVAIAVHDTSSVVGAAESFSPISLPIAIIVKLSRVIWIIPIALLMMFWMNWKKSQQGAESGHYRLNFPLFIILFVLASILNASLPDAAAGFALFAKVGKQLMILALFLIGASLNIKSFKTKSLPVLIFSVLLWASISVISALLLLKGF